MSHPSISPPVADDTVQGSSRPSHTNDSLPTGGARGVGAMSVRSANAVSLCEGWVSHQRTRPAHHVFAQRVFFVRIPVSRFATCGNRWFSTRGFNLLGFRPRDYGPRDGSDPRLWVEQHLRDAGLPVPGGEIVLQTFPRVLGYVFNPISFWLVHDRQENLCAVVCEVNNTFGDTHHYVLGHPDGTPIAPRDVLTADKRMHVSPFCEVRGHYRFRFGSRAGQYAATIEYREGAAAEDRILLTSINGRPGPLDAHRCLSVFLRYPVFTFGVIARIHWHALRLWLKRVPWYPNPPREASSP
jgi:DUF1365 family protein